MLELDTFLELHLLGRQDFSSRDHKRPPILFVRTIYFLNLNTNPYTIYLLMGHHEFFLIASFEGLFHYYYVLPH